MTDGSRYTTLRDYLKVVQRNRRLIFVVMVVFGLAAFGYSLRQPAVYLAETKVSVNNQDEAELLGSSAAPSLTPQQRAAITAEVVTRPIVVERVKRELRTRRTLAELRAAITAQPEAQTGLVVIQAHSSNPRFASRLADTFAREMSDVVTEQARARYNRMARILRPHLNRAKGGDPLAEAALAQRVSQLEALGDIARPATVARYSDVPRSPASPKPIRNTVLGLLVGLTLGILAAFLRDSLDIRLRGSHQIQEQMGLPLLGHVGEEALGQTPMGGNGRKGMARIDLEAFRIVRTNLEFLDIDTQLKSILVTSALPEEGKSTVALSLAYTSAAAGKRTLLVECDLRRPTLANRLKLSREPGLGDYLMGRATPQELLQVVSVESPWSPNGSPDQDAGEAAEQLAGPPPRGQLANLVVLLAGEPNSRSAELLGSDQFRHFLQQVTAAYDVVVLDSSPLLSVVDTLEIIPHVDAVVVCVRATRTTRDQAHAAKRALEHFPPRPMGVVVTGVRPGEEADYGYYYSPAYTAPGNLR